MGNEGLIPVLHEGGVHEAIIAAAPEVPDATPAALTVTEPDSDELQVSGVLTIWLPSMSVTVVLNVSDDPLEVTRS
jgi:hypothetical protein